jgi:hypothetical protein
MRKLETRYGEPVEQLLKRLYWEEGLSLLAISKKLRIPASTIAGWMIRFGINQRAMAEQGAKELSA